MQENGATNGAIGIDVGGTFTDFTVRTRAGETVNFKVPSTPDDPSRAIEDGLRLASQMGIELAEIDKLGHGTTVATNMVIERKGARTALLTTRGFRDVLEIGRQERPHLYDISIVKPKPLVSRYLRLEIDERIDAQGNVVLPLDEEAVRQAARTLEEEGCECAAVAFLHAYAFPEHERRALEILRQVLPEAFPISLSSEVLPEFREFERFSTTVMNAYLQPRMSGYLDRLVSRTRNSGASAYPSTIHSNGGLMSVETAKAFPVQTCLSGPAAGVVGAARMAVSCGFENVITFDVGGTSTDVSLILGGDAAYTTSREVAGYPVRCPMVDVHVIGAGGGSIAQIDRGGSLKVGPESAGARPGPAGYGFGGTAATLSDANIVLHRLNPIALLDGDMPVDKPAAERAIRQIAGELGIDVDACASGIVRIAVSNMARAIRSISVEKGYALKDFALMAFGGAGPLHGSHVAQEVGIGRVIVPPSPGTMCAQGVLMSDITRDYVKTEVQPISPDSWRHAMAARDALIKEGEAWLADEDVPQDRATFSTVIEARFLGQNHEVPVPFDTGDMDAFLAAFSRAHEKANGYTITERPVELVNIRVRAIGHTGKRPVPDTQAEGTVEHAVTSVREAYLSDATGWQSVSVYDRRRLPPDQIVAGPCIIEEPSSTTLVLPGHRAIKDGYGNLIIHLTEERHDAD